MRPFLHTTKTSFLLILLSCFLFSCKAKKGLVKKDIGFYTQDEILNKMLASEFPEWVNAKAKAKISSFYGTDKGQLYLRIRKDSVVWSSVKRLSIEGGRAQINKDSSVFINRLDKTWSSLSLKALQNKYGLVPDISYIQNLIAGIPPQIDTSRYFELTEDESFVDIKSDISGVLHTFKFDRENGFLVSGNFETQYGLSGNWEFSDFKNCSNGQILPFKRIYHLNLGNDESFDLELDFSKIELNVPKSIKFEIPDHYTKI